MTTPLARCCLAASLGLAGLALAAIHAGAAAAGEPAVGDAAPSFVLMGSDGQRHSLAQHRGTRGVVLAWFPKAFTPG